MTVEEVCALPWWQRWIYDEGLLEEFFSSSSEQPADGVPLIEQDVEPAPRLVERFGEG
jgi:hypothetical protein